MTPRILVLGAGFGGLELTTLLSEALGDQLDLTLIDKNDSFFFGFSKLDVMFGRTTTDKVLCPYRSIVKPGVTFRQEAITAIDPEKRRVTTDRGTYDADILVIALGADYEPEATPGLIMGDNEFYSMAGAERLREKLADFTQGHIVIGVSSAPFKCPPAPSETSLMLHDYLTTRGVRDACTITLVIPFGVPIPPSPETSTALLAAFDQRGIKFIAKHTLKSFDSARRIAALDDGTELPCDLLLGVPKHRVPTVISASGISEKNWIQVNPKNLRTKFPGVYAIGDVANVGTARAGVFAEGQARVAAGLDHRRNHPRRRPRRLHRRRHLLHRIRRRPHRKSKRQLPLRPRPHRHVRRTLHLSGRRERSNLRASRKSPLVRHEINPRQIHQGCSS